MEQQEELIIDTGAEEVPEQEPETPAEELPAEAPAPCSPLQEQDMQDFVRQYPGLDPKTIPASVWEAVRRGETLTGAYGRHEMHRLRADNERMRQQLDVLSSNARSRENSLGSMRSSGAARATDGFLLGFDQA